MPNKIHFTPEQIDLIIGSYGTSETILSLSKKYNVVRSVIRRILKQRGIAIIRQVDKKLLSKNQRIKSLSDVLIAEYESGATMVGLKTKYKISFEKIREVFINNNIKIRSPESYVEVKFTEDEEESIVTMYLNGMIIRDISYLFKVSYPTILKVLYSHNVKDKQRGIPIYHQKNNPRGISGNYNGEHFRSMNELSFIINYLEKKNVSFKSGERMKGIEYWDTESQRVRCYYPDFLTDKFMIEIKPKDFWDKPNTIDKKIAAQKFCELNNLEYRLVHYPVILPLILDKFRKSEIIFDCKSREKFVRIYNKFVNFL